MGNIGVLRYAKEYLRRIVMETHENSIQDLGIVESIIKMKVSFPHLITFSFYSFFF